MVYICLLPGQVAVQYIVDFLQRRNVFVVGNSPKCGWINSNLTCNSVHFEDLQPQTRVLLLSNLRTHGGRKASDVSEPVPQFSTSWCCPKNKIKILSLQLWVFPPASRYLLLLTFHQNYTLRSIFLLKCNGNISP